MRYIVQSGDSLTAIARRFGMTWRELYNHPANADFCVSRPDPARIWPGDTVCIPSKNAAASRLGAFKKSEK